MNSRAANPAGQIIVALDVPTRKQALHLVQQLAGKISIFKIGLQLYTAEGPEIVRAVLDTGAQVFLDLKLHDIPNTVARAVESCGNLGVHMLTIHLSGGRAMIEAAVAAKPEPLLLLGVTVLTSLDEPALRQTGVESSTSDQVLRLAQLGATARIDGIVASAHEVRLLRATLGNRIKLVVPGIRPTGSDSGDQKRVMAPRAALDAGADYLVIGRPITEQPDPAEAADRLLDEMRR